MNLNALLLDAVLVYGAIAGLMVVVVWIGYRVWRAL